MESWTLKLAGRHVDVTPVGVVPLRHRHAGAPIWVFIILGTPFGLLLGPRAPLGGPRRDPGRPSGSVPGRPVPGMSQGGPWSEFGRPWGSLFLPPTALACILCVLHMFLYSSQGSPRFLSGDPLLGGRPSVLGACPVGCLGGVGAAVGGGKERESPQALASNWLEPHIIETRYVSLTDAAI